MIWDDESWKLESIQQSFAIYLPDFTRKWLKVTVDRFRFPMISSLWVTWCVAFIRNAEIKSFILPKMSAVRVWANTKYSYEFTEFTLVNESILRKQNLNFVMWIVYAAVNWPDVKKNLSFLFNFISLIHILTIYRYNTFSKRSNLISILVPTRS